ncbi:hypothetical protein [Natrinema sp. 74]|uniref:hypothetical protein n=1 Tax=Natrinema sp. 74 TaxID=3384159 RepID=UPI0038D4D3FD
MSNIRAKIESGESLTGVEREILLIRLESYRYLCARLPFIIEEARQEAVSDARERLEEKECATDTPVSTLDAVEQFVDEIGTNVNDEEDENPFRFPSRPEKRRDGRQ